MSHHAEQCDPEMAEHIKEAFEKDVLLVDDDLVQRFMERKQFQKENDLGPSGEFPEGKLTEHDEGELRMAVIARDGKVILDFGKDITWVGMNGNQAIDLGKALIKHGRKVNKKPDTPQKEVPHEKAV